MRPLHDSIVVFWVLFTFHAPAAMLIEGRDAEPDEFPAAAWAGFCTGTVVGERVLFIAAHCIEDQPRFSFRVHGEKYQADCSIARERQTNLSADYALCETDRKVEGIEYEILNSDPNLLSVGDEILLSGYGCTQRDKTGGVDGILRIGEVKIAFLPSRVSHLIQTYSNTVLCNGDSGGAAYFKSNNGADRVVVGANSTSDFETLSQIAATHTAPAQRFFKAWSGAKKHTICGVHAVANGCRTHRGTAVE